MRGLLGVVLLLCFAVHTNAQKSRTQKAPVPGKPTWSMWHKSALKPVRSIGKLLLVKPQWTTHSGSTMSTGTMTVTKMPRKDNWLVEDDSHYLRPFTDEEKAEVREYLDQEANRSPGAKKQYEVLAFPRDITLRTLDNRRQKVRPLGINSPDPQDFILKNKTVVVYDSKQGKGYVEWNLLSERSKEDLAELKAACEAIEQETGVPFGQGIGWSRYTRIYDEAFPKPAE